MLKKHLMTLALTVPALAQALSLDPGYGDHMVLQQGRLLSIRGTASAGAQVGLKVAGQGYGAVADAQGRFAIAIPGLRPGGPHTLELKAGSEALTLNDVLVGELWLASGQSNMEWGMKLSEDAEEWLKKADRPQLRLFSVARKLGAVQGGKVEGAWTSSTPETAREFSAVAWHFAVQLQEKLKVPVGMVAAPWSGTPGEAWAPMEAMRAEPGLAPLIQAWDAKSEAEKRMFTDGWNFEAEVKDIRLVKADGTKLEISNKGNWFTNAAEGSTAQCKEGLYTGNLKSGAWTGSALSLAPGNAPVDLRGYEAVEYTARSNTRFDIAFGQPDIVDGDNASFSANEPTSAWKTFRHSLKEAKQQGWGQRKDISWGKIDTFKVRIHGPNQFPSQPGLLFDALIRPFQSLTFKGAIWYQGESNLGRHAEYELLLKSIVRGWRAAFRDDQLAFLAAQLPEFGQKQGEPGESSWAALRAAQASILALPRTGLAVTLGLGDAADIHPKRKREVGQRLAAEALGRLYGQPGATGQGPRLAGLRREGKELLARFDSGKAPKKGFAIAGADGVWKWAKVKVHGPLARLSSPDVPEPVKVRYAWADVPEFDDSQDPPTGSFEADLKP